MEEMNKANLVRLQALQLKAYERGMNMDIQTRETDTGAPWIVGSIKPEKADYDMESGHYLPFHFYGIYEGWSEERNREEYENEFKKIEAFIEEHTRLSKYGDNWKPVDGCPKTDSSWLCVTVGSDQVWVDETEGKKFLLVGDDWFECLI